MDVIYQNNEATYSQGKMKISMIQLCSFIVSLSSSNNALHYIFWCWHVVFAMYNANIFFRNVFIFLSYLFILLRIFSPLLIYLRFVLHLLTIWNFLGFRERLLFVLTFILSILYINIKLFAYFSFLNF